jgi:hypothetical protein
MPGIVFAIRQPGDVVGGIAQGEQLAAAGSHLVEPPFPSWALKARKPNGGKAIGRSQVSLGQIMGVI